MGQFHGVERDRSVSTEMVQRGNDKLLPERVGVVEEQNDLRGYPAK